MRFSVRFSLSFARHEFDDIKAALAEQKDAELARMSRGEHTSAASARLLRETRRRKLRGVYARLCASVPGGVDGEGLDVARADAAALEPEVRKKKCLCASLTVHVAPRLT